MLKRFFDLLDTERNRKKVVKVYSIPINKDISSQDSKSTNNFYNGEFDPGSG